MVYGLIYSKGDNYPQFDLTGTDLEDVYLYDINIPEVKEAADDLGISKYPTFLFVEDNGDGNFKSIVRVQGQWSIEQLREIAADIDKYIGAGDETIKEGEMSLGLGLGGILANPKYLIIIGVVVYLLLSEND